MKKFIQVRKEEAGEIIFFMYRAKGFYLSELKKMQEDNQGTIAEEFAISNFKDCVKKIERIIDHMDGVYD